MKLHLLTIRNPKTMKGEARNYLTAILHLAPYKLSGYNVCPMADIAGCTKACLNTAGRGGVGVTHDSVMDGSKLNRIQRARIRKTKLFMEHRDEFMKLLAADIVKLHKRAVADGFKLAIRLNGTSDIRWEDIPLTVEVLGFNRGWTTRCKNIFEAFPEVQFYDYTKIPNRTRALDIPNYHLTFSYSGSPVYAPYVTRAIKNYQDMVNVAVVFSPELLEQYVTEGKEFLGRPVINGDAHDLRFLDPKGCVVGLKAKGPAKKDDNFVVRI